MSWREREVHLPGNPPSEKDSHACLERGELVCTVYLVKGWVDGDGWMGWVDGMGRVDRSVRGLGERLIDRVV